MVLVDVDAAVVDASVVGTTVVVFFSTAVGSSDPGATGGKSVAAAVEEKEKKNCPLSSKIKSNDDVSRYLKYKKNNESQRNWIFLLSNWSHL